MSNAKILVADDNPFVVKMVKSTLEAKNYQVIAALSGEDAIEKAGREKPDLILLDVKMPGLDGEQVFRRLRESGATGSIPVIFLTAAGEEGREKVRLECSPGGETASFIDKVLSASELLEVVEKALGRGREGTRSPELMDGEKKRCFLDTAEEIIGEIGKKVALPGRRKDFVKGWKELELLSHKFKGMAEMAGYNRMRELTGRMEDLSRETSETDLKRLELLNQALEVLKDMVKKIKESEEEGGGGEAEEITARLREMIE